VRVLVFHGYLLRGTGSNVYNASLARALVALGHEVHLLCQDRAAADLPFVDAVGDWPEGRLRVETFREPARCTAYLPDIGDVLPVYVADEYEGFRAVPFPELDPDAVERYVRANERAVREVAERVGPDVALANHLVMGPAILARGLGGGVPYAVKVHGSALEYTVRPHRERFLGYAREGLERAGTVLVGSRHTAESLWEVVGDPALPKRTRLGPPGVDLDAFRPRPAAEAAERLRTLAGRLATERSVAWGGSADAGAALAALDPERGPIVSYVGKLIVSKGVDLLIAAWPLVAARVPGAQLCIVGFGTYRPALERLRDALAGGDLKAAWDVAARGRELEGGGAGELTYLSAFLERIQAPGAGPDEGEYRSSAGTALSVRTHFTGGLEHSDLPDLLPAASAQVVPSTFPEAFGMVAAEAACCGALPLSAAHSGLAEVSAALAPALHPELRPLLSFQRGPGAVEEIATKLTAWLTRPAEARARASSALAERARGRFGWEAVARGVIAAAEGRLEDLPAVESPAGAGVTASRDPGLGEGTG
jgi:glycosyltransferase involved in cell wall biosynthesis